jgi:predicted nucleic acid-binding protein
LPRPRGRPAATRGIYSLENPLLVPPQDVLLDTSFVVHALIGSQTLHVPCRDFLQRLAAADTTLYFNRLLEMELAETAFRIALRERYGRADWRRARLDGRARQRAGRLMEQARDAWQETLDAFAFVRVELHEVEAVVPYLMRLYGLKSYDAVHVGTALYTGTRGVVALDIDFAAPPASLVTLYTSAGRVPNCRARRGGRAAGR